MTSTIAAHAEPGHRHRLDAGVSTPHVSRDLARATLADPRWALDAKTCGDVVLVVNELATGSYLAGATTIDLDIVVHDGYVTVIVRDDRPLGPSTPDPDARARDMLLDTVSTFRTVAHDAAGTVNVAHVHFAATRPVRHLSLVR